MHAMYGPQPTSEKKENNDDSQNINEGQNTMWYNHTRTLEEAQDENFRKDNLIFE